MGLSIHGEQSLLTPSRLFPTMRLEQGSVVHWTSSVDTYDDLDAGRILGVVPCTVGGYQRFFRRFLGRCPIAQVAWSI